VKRNKLDFAQAALADIEMYSEPATEQNMQNIASRFEHGIAVKPATRTHKTRLLRVVLAAAMSVIMVFTVAMAASAEFRGLIYNAFDIELNRRTISFEFGEVREAFPELGIVPELIPVTATNGKEGFIYRFYASISSTMTEEEMDSYDYFKSSSEVFEHNEIITVPVYDADGVTVIGEYVHDFNITVSDTVRELPPPEDFSIIVPDTVSEGGARQIIQYERRYERNS